MYHAWVGGGLPLPNSAVPVLPYESAGSRAPAAVPSPRMTLAMNDFKVASTPGLRGGTVGPGLDAGELTSAGARH